MAPTPEEQARQNIDVLLTATGWIVQERKDAYLFAGPAGMKVLQP
jgi:type I site-specific restriction endonuclease